MNASAAAGAVAISVVIPLYNHQRYVRAALASVLGQTIPPCDIVVIDDGSHDKGADAAQTMLRGMANAQVVRQDNQGAHATLNRAIGLARGDYIAVLNSDDLFPAGKLARCQEMLAASPRPMLIAGRVGLIDAQGRRQSKGVAVEWLARAHGFAQRSGLAQLALLNENHVATTSNLVFSRDLWTTAGGFAPLRYCHDLDFLMQGFAHGTVAIDTEHEHVLYRVHPANTIAEGIEGVRLELAAVIADTLVTQGKRVLPTDDNGSFAAFGEFLRNKALSDLALYFTTLRPRFADRDAFYRFATTDPARARFIAHLQSAGAC